MKILEGIQTTIRLVRAKGGKPTGIVMHPDTRKFIDGELIIQRGEKLTHLEGLPIEEDDKLEFGAAQVVEDQTPESAPTDAAGAKRAEGDSVSPEATIQFSTVNDPTSFSVTHMCDYQPGAPEDCSPCKNPATGMIRVKLNAAPAVQKRYGKRAMMTFVMGLHVCASCFPRGATPALFDDQFRRHFGAMAQRLNSGILVDWNETEFEHASYEDKDVQLLLRQQGKISDASSGRSTVVGDDGRYRNPQKPAPAAPQPEGAGDAERIAGS